MVLGTFGVYYGSTESGGPVREARTIALNTLVFFEIFFLFSVRSLAGPAHSVSIRSNEWLPVGILACLASQILIVYWSPLNALFETAPIGLLDWVTAALIASSVFLAIEAEKWIIGTRAKGTSAARS
jgi:magnesium-transporting ATPase (P-type)